jgi:hypothetical protein
MLIFELVVCKQKYFVYLLVGILTALLAASGSICISYSYEYRSR